ncbi:MAG: hypothetical protein FVQ83_00785 [Chloroflexi bacterium]|nr:hypothetical protein [Chloroflexota bacterium]
MLLLLALTACNLSLAGEETESPFQVQENEGFLLPSPTLPTCNDIQQDPCPGFECYPYLELITELDPTYIWTYPSLYDCHPTGYEISVASMQPEEDYFIAIQNPDIFYDIVDTIDPQTGGPPTSLTTGALLEPATLYVWEVRALLNGIEGGSDRMMFWTGLICDTSTLVAPELIFPADTSQVTDIQVRLMAWYPQDQECLPEDYEFQLSTDPNFTQLEPLVEPQYYVYTDSPQSQLNDCTRYYWRARAVNNDGVGPYSAAFVFDTRFEGQCLLVSPIPAPLQTIGINPTLPPTETNTPIPIITATPLPDTIGPNVSGVSHSPDQINLEGTKPDTIAISATVTDPAGVGSVTLYYRLSGGSIFTTLMSPIGGGVYQVDIGPFKTAGLYQYYILATDTLANANCSSGDLATCPGGTFVVNIP